MKVRTRLLWLGVAAPALALTAALSGADYLFRRHALASVDRELLARAAVESVGAFDGPERTPHLHLGRATFPPGFVELDPRGALFDERGLAASDPPDEPPIARGSFEIEAVERPELWTADERREFAVTLHAPNGQPYLLRLSCSLGPVQQMLGAYVRTTTALLATVVLALLGLWAWLARSLSRRLEHITERLPRGDELPVWRKHEPADDDEISALDHGLGAAFERLRKAKETRDEFIARAAHELKTPLGVMAAEMDLALSRERSSAELRAALASSRGEVRRLAELSTKLLDLSAVHGVELDWLEVDFVRLLYESLDQHNAALEQRQIQLRVEAPEQLIIRADPLLVRQAIENLLANAIRYSPQRGALQLIVTCDGHSARLDVRDEGPGVPAAEREKIFEPFVRGTRAEGPGTGLGLSIVQAIAARLQGSIEIVPSERGAWFRLHLPAGAGP